VRIYCQFHTPPARKKVQNRPWRPKGQRYISTLSLTSVLHCVGGQRHAPATLPPRERDPVPTVSRGSWVGQRADMDRCGKSRPQSPVDWILKWDICVSEWPSVKREFCCFSALKMENMLTRQQFYITLPDLKPQQTYYCCWFVCLFVSCVEGTQQLEINMKSSLSLSLHRFSKNLWVASKFYALEGWHEESSILRAQKYWVLPYKI
jgi:hypothetical protein